MDNKRTYAKYYRQKLRDCAENGYELNFTSRYQKRDIFKRFGWQKFSIITDIEILCYHLK